MFRLKFNLDLLFLALAFVSGTLALCSVARSQCTKGCAVVSNKICSTTCYEFGASRAYNAIYTSSSDANKEAGGTEHPSLLYTCTGCTSSCGAGEIPADGTTTTCTKQSSTDWKYNCVTKL
jgi:hypothetical protein